MSPKISSLFILLILPCLFSVFACQDKYEVLYFRVLDVFLINGIESESSFRGFNELGPDEEIAYSDFRLIISIGVEYFSQVDEHSEYNLSAPFMLTSLMADNPIDPIASQYLESISIVSNSDFIFQDSTVVPAGNSLNEYLVTSIDETDNNLNVSEYLEWVKVPSEHPLMFKLKMAPLDDQEHRFNIWYKMKDVPNIASTSQSIMITL